MEKRMRGIAVRAELTEEWKNRDVRQEREYAILTADSVIKDFLTTVAHGHTAAKVIFGAALP